MSDVTRLIDTQLKIKQICTELGADKFISMCRYNYEMIDDVTNLYDDDGNLVMTMDSDDYLDEIWLSMPEFKRYSEQ